MSCCMPLIAMAQDQLDITGSITDNKGEPLIGVSITVKDEKGLGTISNINGKYSIKIQQYQTLVFSYIGFKTVSILVKGDTKIINIKMQEEK